MSASHNPAVLSYYSMRRAVGLIALTLPLALASGSILSSLLGPAHALPHPLLERSVSDYYYTSMRDYLVGSLCAIAAFLACSRGYDVHDEIAGYLAGGFTFAVAFFPSFNPRGGPLTALDLRNGYIHTVFAALMFLSLAYFCLFLFRRSTPDQLLTRRKRHRNRIYGACGLVIVVCLVLLVSLTVGASLSGRRPSPALFWCESLALAAFGVAWLTKGKGILRDLPPHHPAPMHAQPLPPNRFRKKQSPMPTLHQPSVPHPFAFFAKGGRPRTRALSCIRAWLQPCRRTSPNEHGL